MKLKPYKDYWPEVGHGPPPGFREGYLSDLEIGFGLWLALPINIAVSENDWSLLDECNHKAVLKAFVAMDSAHSHFRDITVSVKTTKGWDDRQLFLIHPKASELIALGDKFLDTLVLGNPIDPGACQAAECQIIEDEWAFDGLEFEVFVDSLKLVSNDSGYHESLRCLATSCLTKMSSLSTVGEQLDAFYASGGTVQTKPDGGIWFQYAESSAFGSLQSLYRHLYGYSCDEGQLSLLS